MKLKSSFILLTLGVIFMSASMKTCNKDVVLKFKAKMDPIFIDVPDTMATSLDFLYYKLGIAYKLDSTCTANSIPINNIQSLKVVSNSFTMISVDGVLGGTFDFYESLSSGIRTSNPQGPTENIGSVNPVLGNTTVSMVVDPNKDFLPIIKSENIDFGVSGKLRSMQIKPMRIRADVELEIGYKLN